MALLCNRTDHDLFKTTECYHRLNRLGKQYLIQSTKVPTLVGTTKLTTSLFHNTISLKLEQLRSFPYLFVPWMSTYRALPTKNW